MILRRFLQRFKQHQWGAIATELAIVIIGVFLGIQVSDWNEAQAEVRRMVFKIDAAGVEIWMFRSA